MNVNILLNIVSIALTVLTMLIVGSFFKQLPIVLTEFSTQFTDQIQTVFLQPKVQKAMGILGNRSGEVRLEKADVQKINEFIKEENPIIGQLSDTIGIEPDRLVKYAKSLGLDSMNFDLGKILNTNKSNTPAYSTRSGSIQKA